MYPFSFSCDQMVPDEEDLAEVSLGASRALRDVHGRVYQTGKACDVSPSFSPFPNSSLLLFSMKPHFLYSLVLIPEPTLPFIFPSRLSSQLQVQQSITSTHLLQLKSNGVSQSS